jgi:uroporphyrinogen-III synthase
MSSIDPPITGNIPILLLRTKSVPNDGYQEQFFAAGNGTHFEPIFVPVLEHKFLDAGLSVVRDLLVEKGIGKQGNVKYGGMIFTSQRAVEAFMKLVQEGNGISSIPILGTI